MTLTTRKPTGVVPWPLILIEGGEKTGKSYACAVLSASKKVGRTLWLDWGEGAADEYGAVPGARYEVIEHDGSWASILGQIAAAKEEAQRAKDAGEPPVVLILDSITCEWEQLKDWASDRAKTQPGNRDRLQRNPNAEVQVTMNLWNDAAARHRKLMTALMTFPGIVVITARGGETALVENGKPVEGKKSYRVDGHKSLAYDASCWIRLSRDTRPVIVGARSVNVGVRPGIDPTHVLAKDWSLESLIFDVLKCNPATAQVRDLAEPEPEVLTPEQIRDEALNPKTSFERIRTVLYPMADRHYSDVTLMNGTGDDEPLVSIVKRAGDERRSGPAHGPKLAAVPAEVNGKAS
jgi:AAA domain